MNEYEIQKVKLFVQDEAMFNAVSRAVLDTFLKTREGDVHTKAAQRMAIDFHFESWENLKKIQSKSSQEVKEKVQNAL